MLASIEPHALPNKVVIYKHASLTWQCFAGQAMAFSVDSGKPLSDQCHVICTVGIPGTTFLPFLTSRLRNVPTSCPWALPVS